MSELSDIESLRFKGRQHQKSNPKPKNIFRPRRGEKFLKGPIPWTWLTTAARLPGKSLHVSLVIWLMHFMKRSDRVLLSPKLLREMGINRSSAYRGITWLEKAGLICVSRRRGRGAIVLLANPFWIEDER